MSKSRILNANGHPFGETDQVVLMPVKTEVRRSSKPRMRVTPGMKMRNFYKVKADGTIEAYTPKAVNRNPNASDSFHLGIYKSPTAAMVPATARDDT